MWSVLCVVIVLLSSLCFALQHVHKSCPSNGNHNPPTRRIINGHLASENQFPWHATIISNRSGFENGQLCGGSLISPEWILTAAHCANGSIQLIIGLGSVNMSSPKWTFIVNEYHIHPQYNSVTKNNDIALIRLPFKVPLSDSVQVINLPNKSMVSRSFASMNGLVSGHGRLYDKNITVSQLLQWLTVCILDNEECLEFYKPEIIVCSSLCAFAIVSKEQNVCGGDSGGALSVNMDGKFVQIGVISFTPKSCLDGPAGYMRVTSYLDWIANFTNLVL